MDIGLTFLARMQSTLGSVSGMPIMGDMTPTTRLILADRDFFKDRFFSDRCQVSNDRMSWVPGEGEIRI